MSLTQEELNRVGTILCYVTNDLREGCQGTVWIRWHNDNVYIDEHDKQ